MSTTKLAEALRLGIEALTCAGSHAECQSLEVYAKEQMRAALASYEAEAKPAEGFVTSADSLTTQLRGYAVAIQDDQPYWADKIKAACDELEAQAEAKPAPEPFGYVSEHNCEGPYQFQFHKSQASVYWDNCKAVTAVYRAPAEPADLCERICAAIKATDDKSVDEANYMLDSNDCIAIVREHFAAAPAAPAPEPLSFTHIDGLAAVDFPSKQWNAAQRFARAIERAHGIGISVSEGEQA
jgi:hypothetical protein